MLVPEVFVVKQSGFRFDHRLADVTRVSKHVGKMNILHVVSNVCSVETGFATNRTHVLVLALSLVSIIFDKGVKIFR